MPSASGKKKGMKKLKGFITGSSRRERRKSRRESENKVEGPDDASTLYGADLDASVVGDGRSVSSVPAVSKPSSVANPVQVILLIMDPASRRFELLQLEFDSAMSKIADIFQQIPEAATEEILQKTTYKAIITPKGEELKPEMSLSEFAGGATVVIAVPQNTEESLEKCAAMAVPILTNNKVHKMLLSVGIKQEDLPEKPIKKKKIVQPVEKIEEKPKEEEKAVEEEKPTEEENTSTIAPMKLVEEERTAPTPSPLVDETLQTIEETPSTKEEQKEDDDDDTNYFVIGVLFAIFAHLFFKAHMSISTPISPGSTLSLGKSKNSCGLLGSVPFFECEPKSISMGTDGILKIFEGEELVLSLEGKVCAEEEVGCVDGLVVDEDGIIKIGGEKAKAKTKTTVALTPFPFSEDVVLYKSGIRNYM